MQWNSLFAIEVFLSSLIEKQIYISYDFVLICWYNNFRKHNHIHIDFYGHKTKTILQIYFIWLVRWDGLYSSLLDLFNGARLKT